MKNTIKEGTILGTWYTTGEYIAILVFKNTPTLRFNTKAELEFFCMPKCGKCGIKLMDNATMVAYK